MVQFLKAKKTTFINKPVGVNAVNTGAVQAGQTLANVGKSLATEFFKEAEEEQIKIGKDVGLSLPTRDTEGKLLFQDVPSSLSAVAKNAAEPIIRKRYEDALNVDIFNRLNEIRNKSRSSQEFSNTVNNEMGSYIEQTKISGGGQYVGSMTQTIAKLSAQHVNAMATEETKEQMRIASLNALQITNLNIVDLQSFATKELLGTNINNIDAKISELQENVNDIVASNNDNLKVNNLDVNKYTKADGDAKSLIGKALANTLLVDKDSAQALEIQDYFLSGTLPKHLLDKDGNLDPKSKKIMDLIQKSPYRNEVYAYIKSRQDTINEKQNRIRADQNYKRLIEAENRRLLMDSPVVKENSMRWVDGKVVEINQLTDLILSSDTLSEENKAKVSEWERSILQAATNQGIKIKVNGEEQTIMITDTQANKILSGALIRGIENSTLDSGLFKSVSSKSALRDALINRDPVASGLNADEKKVYNRILEITSASLSGNSIRLSIASALNDNIVTQNSLETNRKKDKEQKNIVTSFFGGTNSPSQFKNTNKEQELMTQVFDITPQYFADNFESELSSQNQRALAIHEGLKKGHFTSAFTTFINNSINSNDSRHVKTALSLYNKYSQVDVGGQRVDRLYKNLDSQVYAVLGIASQIIPAYEGQTSFFGVEGLGPNGTVTTGQMMTKINEIYKNRENPNNVDSYKSSLKAIVGDSKNSYQYLLTQDFGRDEAQELSFLVDAAASMNLSKKQTDQLLIFAKDNIYLDGEGLVFDALDSGSKSFRSKHAFNAVFDPKKTPIIRTFIQSKLNELEHFNDKGRKVGRFTLAYKPTQVIDGKVQYTTGTDVGTVDIDIEDTIVQLQPIQYGSSKTDVRYVAVTKHPSSGFMRPIRLPNGSVMSFDANDLSAIRLGDDT